MFNIIHITHFTIKISIKNTSIKTQNILLPLSLVLGKRTLILKLSKTELSTV